MKLQEIYIDLDIIGVDKPSGLLSVPGRSPLKQDCLLHRVQVRYPDALLVHRLDMDTSGIMLFARSLPMQRALSALFERREIKKEYIAWVEGVVEQEEGLVELPLRKDMQQSIPPRHIVDHQQGKPALTRWRVCERAQTRTRLALTPLTGRSHQLRVHMAEIGHPIVGDPIYGQRADRLWLHAQQLRFIHPTRQQTIELESPSPF